MKKIISAVVGFLVLLMFSGVSFCTESSGTSVADQSSKKTSIADQSSKKPSVADQGSQKPSVGDQSSKKPSIADQSSKKPSVADQSSQKPSVADQSSKKPSIADQSSKKPSVSDQSSKKPSVADQSSKKKSLTSAQSSKKPSSWLQSASKIASSGPYVSGRIGTSFFTQTDYTQESEVGNLEFKQGYAMNMAGGFKFKAFRVEGELGYQKNSIDKCLSRYCGDRSGSMEAYSLLVNGYYDFINKTKFTPYVTAGLGISRVNSNLDDYDVNLSDKGLTYQFGAGVAYSINRILSVDFRYRYFATKGHDLAGTKDGFTANNVLLGLRYNF